MSIQVDTRVDGDITIITVVGRVTLGESANAFRAAMTEALAAGARKIILNLGGVSYMDSSGIGELFSCYSRVAGQMGSLKLVHLTKFVVELLQITKMYRLFDVQADEAEALRSFG